MKSLKWLLASVVVGLCVFIHVRKVLADGNIVYAPGPIISATGSNYGYPTTPSPAAGGTLVNDGVGAFRWSNTAIASTSSLTVLQFPAMPSLTATQLQGSSGLIASTTGQMAFCSNCAAAGAKGTMCVSTGTANTFQWVLSTGTVCQ